MSENTPDKLQFGMYIPRADRKASERFGLRFGHTQVLPLLRRAGWFNALGEKLGYGDLTGFDVARIARELRSDEMFVVLNDEDSVKSPEPTLCTDWVAQKAQFGITKDEVLTSTDKVMRSRLRDSLDTYVPMKIAYHQNNVKSLQDRCVPEADIDAARRLWIPYPDMIEYARNVPVHEVDSLDFYLRVYEYARRAQQS